MLKRIDDAVLDQVCAAAGASPRLRKNHNLHEEADVVQRFLNALQPGTYVRPHRHVRDDPRAAFECFLTLRGALGLLLFDEAGQIVTQERISAAGPLRGIEVGPDRFHTLVALEPDTVMFELKQGPYVPVTDKDFLAGFPLEGTAEAIALERSWRDRFR